MKQVYDPASEPVYSSQKILGIDFFNGEVDQAVSVMWRRGGFLVAPSGTCFARLRRDTVYRQAVVSADLAIPDSGAMVVLWKLLKGQSLNRISGLCYLQCLVVRLDADQTRRVLWILPNEHALTATARWLEWNQISFADADLYVAPFYGPVVEDRSLLEKIESQRPTDVVVGIGSGPQEKLGHYLRDRLGYRPAIHCIGAALGFLTGDQVSIPDWADRFYLGWLFRLMHEPRIFIPRLSRALDLPWLIWRYGEQMPPGRGK